eukprot:Skav208329  [mRNA]  locus=scaffold1961:118223:118633:+ [translate_table: standard]
MEAALLMMAQNIAALAMAWPEELLNDLEAARECCRTVCYHVGISEDTDPLADLWTTLTMTQSMLNGHPGDDIDVSGMGLTNTPADLTCLRKLNIYQKKALKQDLTCLYKTVDRIEEAAPFLIWQVRMLANDIEQQI